MVSLIVILLSIGLLTAYLLATMNYLPGWQKSADSSQALAQDGLYKFEKAYLAVTKANGGLALPVYAQTDGGIANNFTAILGFLPKAPGDYMYVYGQHSNDGTRYAGMNYVCLAPMQGASRDEGAVRGLNRLRQAFPADQLIFSNGCGASSSMIPSQGTPQSLYVTYYMVYSPELG